MKRPIVLAGDLNDLPTSAALRDLQKFWQRSSEEVLPTVPVQNPTRQIDYVLFRPASHWRMIETKVLDEATASDHRAVLAVCELVVADADSQVH